MRMAPGLLLAFVIACGQAQPAASAPLPAPASPTSPAATATVAPPTSAPPSAAPIQVADFKIVAYQGDATFGGHDGHLAAAFAAGKPVVLLFYAGL